ncbi:aromatic acid exporter family protein [Paenibacillus sp. SC116]|uniref:aromatic acid exporter family protein n=1 Tax=Paenibacillus sp. SC116 TaxID=2968986 RepID=UPI00215AE1A9|nr:aromatic acid exporter family protein [Paenibacillus sp. SC116]MCR8842849.1 aromatic acid exporter family protein [Paenibacillus sp. SC116]
MLFGFVGFRVIKTAIAAILSIIVADLLGLDNHLGAGTLAILAVEVTRKKSISSTSARFFASIVSLAVASCLFWIFGFHLWVLAAYILLTFPLVARLNFKQGIVTSAVVVFHLFAEGQVTLDILWNEVLLLSCGLGAATLVNLAYMPKEHEKLWEIRKEVDACFSAIFLQISRNLRDASYVWDGKEMIDTAANIESGIATASKALENRLLPSEEEMIEEKWLLYFYMRKTQLDSIQNLMQLLSQIYQTMPYNQLIANLFEQLSEDVKHPLYTGTTERLLNDLEPQFRELPLPTTREELEVSAAILQVFRELRVYLKVAKKDKKELTVEG